MGIEEPTRRNFLKYAAVTSLSVLANLALPLIYPQNAPKAQEEVAYGKNGEFEGNNISLASPTSGNPGDNTYNHAYNFEARVATFFGLLKFDFKGTLEIRVDNASYHSELKVFKKEGKKEPVLAHEADGITGNGRLLPEKARIKRDFKILFYAKQDEFTFNFQYDETGKLVRFTRVEKQKVPEDFGGEQYNSSADILTSIVQHLWNLKNDKKPHDVAFIDYSSRPVHGAILRYGDNEIVKLGQYFYFREAKIAYKGFHPSEISIDNLYLKRIPVGTLEARINVVS